MHDALRGLSGVEAIADDTLVYGCGDTMHKAIKDHDANLENLLQRARKVSLRFNVEKLRLRREEVPYMGHILSSNGLKIDPEEVEAVMNLQPPTDKQSTQRLSGLSTFSSNTYPYYPMFPSNDADSQEMTRFSCGIRNRKSIEAH